MEKLKALKILYMGTPRFSAELLRILIEDGYNIIGVVTQKDALVGRKKLLTPSPVKEVALHYNIPVFTPHKIRLEYDFVLNLKPDLILTFAYGQIVPLAVLEAPTYKALNLHGSILPKYRGASPIQMALINNEEETGVTLMEMVEKMDAGAIFGIETFPLLPSDNFATVSEKMVKASFKLIKEVLPKVISGENKGIAQDETKVTYAPLLKAADEALNVTEDRTNLVLGKIQAFSPEPGANVIYLNETLKLYDARFLNNKVNKPVGTLFIDDENNLVIQLKDGQIKVLTLQKSGKNIIEAKSFINGEKQKLPTILKTKGHNE